MQALFDLIPVLLFFLAFKWYGIYVATAVGIVATAYQVLATLFFQNKIDKMQWATLIIFIVMGSMTFYFHNPLFVKWKPTLVFWGFGIVFLGSHFFSNKTLAQRMMAKAFAEKAMIPDVVWKKLNAAWAVFFIVLGMINLYIAYQFSTNAWVNFKLYGIMGLLLLFSIAQVIYLSRYMTEK